MYEYAARPIPYIDRFHLRSNRIITKLLAKYGFNIIISV